MVEFARIACKHILLHRSHTGKVSAPLHPVDSSAVAGPRAEGAAGTSALNPPWLFKFNSAARLHPFHDQPSGLLLVPHSTSVPSHPAPPPAWCFH